jgi:hypothetical protein
MLGISGPQVSQVVNGNELDDIGEFEKIFLASFLVLRSGYE